MKMTISILVLLVVVSNYGASSNSKVDDYRQISVTGNAAIDVPPDHVKIRVSIATVDKSHEVAFANNAMKVKKTLAKLLENGIPQKDVATNYMSLTKKEAQRENDIPLFIGYEASQSITIILRDMSKYDYLLSSIIGAGVNDIDSVSFCISNEQEKRKEARLLAIQAAQEKAESMAKAFGQRVCMPLRINETPESNRSANSNVYYYSEPEVVSSSLVPSSKTITASVDVTFMLCD